MVLWKKFWYHVNRLVEPIPKHPNFFEIDRVLTVLRPSEVLLNRAFFTFLAKNEPEKFPGASLAAISAHLQPEFAKMPVIKVVGLFIVCN